MKKQIIISAVIGVFFLFSSRILWAQQQTWKDTLNHLQQIVVSKANYIGKPFSVLEGDLKFKIKSFSPFGAGNRYEETSTTFYFIPIRKHKDFSYPRLRIFWIHPLDMRISDSLYSKDTKNLGAWNKETGAFYSSAIISDIRAVQ